MPSYSRSRPTRDLGPVPRDLSPCRARGHGGRASCSGVRWLARAGARSTGVLMSWWSTAAVVNSSGQSPGSRLRRLLVAKLVACKGLRTITGLDHAWATAAARPFAEKKVCPVTRAAPDLDPPFFPVVLRRRHVADCGVIPACPQDHWLRPPGRGAAGDLEAVEKVVTAQKGTCCLTPTDR
jgi:hypothetical protein